VNNPPPAPLPPLDSPVAASAAPAAPTFPAPTSATRPMYWSVRRELWENRSIVIAPLLTAAVVLFGFLISTITSPRRMHRVLALDPARQRAAVTFPFDVVELMILLTAILVGMFFCLDALHGERRDRSILFWKSLPVSDLTTVLSKASIPLVVLPLLVFAIVVAVQMMMLVLSTAVLLGTGVGVATLWARLPLFQMWLVLLYALAAIALWHAPIYGWLLLVSGWARRATFLWAVLPPLAIAAFEKIAFSSSHFGSLMQYRLFGWFSQAFIPPVGHGVPADPLTSLDPVRFFCTPGLWLGLMVAAALLAAAVRLRRYRGPI
jgi:ABC-2 type transport system permease protein